MTEEQRLQTIAQAEALLKEGTVMDNADRDELDRIYRETKEVISWKKEDATDEEKTAKFVEYKTLILAFGKTLGVAKYMLPFTQSEFKYAAKNCRYNRSETALAMRLRDNFIKPTEAAFKADKNHMITLSIEELTILSYFIGRHEEQGFLSLDIFTSVTDKIANITRVYEYYQTMGNELSEEGGNWIQGLEPEEVAEPVEAEATETQETITE